jgi:hypothetical protein
MSTDWEWLSFILCMDIGLFFITPLLPGMSGAVTGTAETLVSYNIIGVITSLFSFGLAGSVTGIGGTLISAFFFVINGMGIYLVAKMVRGN